MDYYESYGFISYKRGPGAGADAWYATCQQSIAEYVQTEVGEHEIDLFFDRHSIAPGAAWMETLRNGVDRAPLLMPFFSPGYFSSPYCVAELQTFMKREEHLGVPRGTLIHAARITTNKMFPDWANALQAAPMEDYFQLGPTFDKSDIRHEFDTALKAFAQGACEKIFDISETDALTYAPGFPKMPEMPEPVARNRVSERLFGPRGQVPKPFSQQGTAA